VEEYLNKIIWERKLEVIKKLGGKCKVCGLDDIRVLDINHIDRDKKDKHKNFGRPRSRWLLPAPSAHSWLKRLQNWEGDLDNIEILCANCHRKHTWEQMGYRLEIRLYGKYKISPEYCKIAEERLKNLQQTLL